MINLHGCITVYKKKKEGAFEEAGEELMVNAKLQQQPKFSSLYEVQLYDVPLQIGSACAYLSVCVYVPHFMTIF